MTDQEIMIALIGQVASAAHGDNESKVTTIITRPMWNAFCRAVKLPEDSNPTAHIGLKTIRVYGSRTVIVERDGMASVSFKP